MSTIGSIMSVWYLAKNKFSLGTFLKLHKNLKKTILSFYVSVSSVLGLSSLKKRKTGAKKLKKFEYTSRNPRKCNSNLIFYRSLIKLPHVVSLLLSNFCPLKRQFLLLIKTPCSLSGCSGISSFLLYSIQSYA